MERAQGLDVKKMSQLLHPLKRYLKPLTCDPGLLINPAVAAVFLLLDYVRVSNGI